MLKGMGSRYLILVMFVGPTLPAFAAEAPEAHDILQPRVDADGTQHVQTHAGGYFFHPDRVIVRLKVPVVMPINCDWGLLPIVSL